MDERYPKGKPRSTSEKSSDRDTDESMERVDTSKRKENENKRVYSFS